MIFFDIDETLFDNQRAQHFAALSFYNEFKELQAIYDKPAFLQSWNEITEKSLQRFFANQISFRQQRRTRLTEIFQKDFPRREADEIFAIYLKFYEKNWRLFDDVIPCLNLLGPLKLGIISNGEKGQQRQKLRDLNILERFAVIVISDDIGISKPNPKIFWHACDTASENRAECYYVGDNFDTDAKAASEAGLNAIWLNREQARGHDATLKQISTLAQLPKLIHSETGAEDPTANRSSDSAAF